MTAFGKQLSNFAGSEDGATAIEYGLIAALLAVGVLIALTSLGGSVGTMFGYVSQRAGDELDNIDDI